MFQYKFYVTNGVPSVVKSTHDLDGNGLLSTAVIARKSKRNADA